jgi:hypothetical protein
MARRPPLPTPSARVDASTEPSACNRAVVDSFCAGSSGGRLAGSAEVGRAVDLVVRGETYPPVTGLVAGDSGGRTPAEAVEIAPDRATPLGAPRPATSTGARRKSPTATWSIPLVDVDQKGAIRRRLVPESASTCTAWSGRRASDPPAPPRPSRWRRWPTPDRAIDWAIQLFGPGLEPGRRDRAPPPNQPGAAPAPAGRSPTSSSPSASARALAALEPRQPRTRRGDGSRRAGALRESGTEQAAALLRDGARQAADALRDLEVDEVDEPWGMGRRRRPPALLCYREGSAGGFSDPNLVLVRPHQTVGRFGASRARRRTRTTAAR